MLKGAIVQQRASWFVLMGLFLAAVACVPAVDQPPEEVPTTEACSSDRDCPVVCGLEGVCVDDRCPATCPADTVCAESAREPAVCEPPGERGELCFHNDDLLLKFEKACAPPLVCGVIPGGFASDGFCVPVDHRSAAEPCAVDDECTDGLLCSPERFRCVAPLGVACEQDAGCASDFCGDNGVCVANECSPVGSTICADGTPCSGGGCGRVCAAPRAEGETCFAVDGVCTEGFACAAGLHCSDAGVCVVDP
jgi:hypothetical protein